MKRSKRNRSRGKRRRATRERRRQVAALLAEGRSLRSAAEELGCDEDALRAHARALRAAARRRVADEWRNETDAANADLIEAVDDALLRTREAQRLSDKASPNYRKLLWLEVYTLRHLARLRRELAADLAAARTAQDNDGGDDDAFGSDDEWAHPSNEELLGQMEALGMDAAPFRKVFEQAASSAGLRAEPGAGDSMPPLRRAA